MKIETRLAQIEDLKALMDISYKEDPKDGYEKDFRAQIKQNSAFDTTSFLFVAVVNGELVGHGKLFIYNSDKIKTVHKSPFGRYLNGVIVKSNFRKKGVATALFNCRRDYVNWAKLDLFSIVASDNAASIKYHESVGMTQLQKAPGFLNVSLKCGEGILFSGGATSST